ncbi:hypothetical protein ACH4FX_39405 [Streptomyces sp. NPDC018019]|uniref:hypothetical protein n=1 Tax=Streptomyces sp. NPDC018019 TaxID=3365030 RepID=UPI0037908842
MPRPVTHATAISITALTLASALTVTAASALDHREQRPAPKRLHATAESGSFDVLARRTSGLKAKFSEVDGTPVAGLPVKFTVSGEKALLCKATTDPDGYAECKNPGLPPLPVSAVKLLTAGYDATFAGNSRYAPATAHNTVSIDMR